jgi:ribosomal protein L11 methyltransferase
LSGFCLRCRASAEEAWALAAELEARGAASVALYPLTGNESLLEPEPGATPLADAMRLEALFDSRAAAESTAADIGADRACSVKPLPARDWIKRGREGFVPRRCGERLWIVPEWCETPDPDAINVRLAPGLGFGTGGHPSTALCLEWLARAEIAGKTVLDYGTGSGVLAIAAAKLGAARVLAVDTDPQALAAARANADRNGVTVEVSSPEALAMGAVDVLVANILARPLIALAAEFQARARVGSRIVLAGITADQADVVAAAYLPCARVCARAERAGWILLELIRSAAR